MNKQEILKKCLNTTFPQTILTEKSLDNNINYLFRTENLSVTSNTCTQLIQHFHNSIWNCNVKGYKSPYEAWYDPALLNKSIDNRLKYKGSELSPKDIRAGFSIGKIAPKISIFRPATAKYIIKKYLNEYAEIFDPCSGYSGRLLGAASLGKKYIGQDINSTTIEESKNLITYFNLTNCSVSCKNSLCTKGEYECLFTCTPYYDKENWNQSIEELSCDEWIDICLKNYKCKSYIFVVDNTFKYKDNVVEQLTNKSYLSNSVEYIVKIDKSL